MTDPPEAFPWKPDAGWEYARKPKKTPSLADAAEQEFQQQRVDDRVVRAAMPTAIHAQFPLPNGQTQTLEFPSGTDPHVIDREVQRATAEAWKRKVRQKPTTTEQLESPTSGRNLLGAALEPNLALLTGVGAGIGNLGIEGASIAANKAGLKKTPEPFAKIPSYSPRTEGGKNAMQVVGAPGRALDWIGSKLQEYGKKAGASDADAAYAKWAFNVLSTMLGGKGAKTAAEKVPGVLKPKELSPEVKQVRKLGVNTTLGQTKGGAVNKLEQAASSLPIIGERPTIQRQKRVNEFNVGVVNHALQKVGDKLPADIPAGHKAVEYAQDALDKKYSELLPKMLGSLDLQGPFGVPSLRMDLTRLKQEAGAQLPKEEAKLFNNFIDSRIIDPYTKTPHHGMIDGVSMDKIRRDVSDQINKFGKGTGHQQTVAQLYKQVKQAMDRMTEMMNPKHAGELGGIRRAYSELVMIESAAKDAPDGVFTTEAYERAVRKHSAESSRRNRRYAAGKAPMQGIAEAGRKVLGKTLPSSGTTERALASDLMLMGPSALLGGPKGVAAAATIPAIYSNIGNKALQSFLENPGSLGRTFGVGGMPLGELQSAQQPDPSRGLEEMMREAGMIP